MRAICQKLLEMNCGTAIALKPSIMPMCPCRSPTCQGGCCELVAALPVTPRTPQHYKKKSRQASKESLSPATGTNKKSPNRRRRRKSSASSSGTISSNDSAYGSDPHSGTETPNKGGSPYRMSPVEGQQLSRTGFSKIDFVLSPTKFDIYGIDDNDNRHAGCKYHTLPDPENLPKPPTEWFKGECDAMSQQIKMLLKL